jgi:signal transduction histidine kinase
MPHPSILLIDDDPLALELITLLIQQGLRRAKVIPLSDPRQALTRCRESAIDCAIIDYEMPGENGLAVAKALRREFPYLPIILCTGTGDEALVARALTSGVNDYIPKPKMTPDSLGRAIRNAIRTTTQSRTIDEQRGELEGFAYALAHDFKQPVRQLMVFSALIADAVRSGDTSEIDRHVAFLTGAAGRLDALVDVMSQYTLLNKPPALGDVDLNGVLAGIRASLGHYLAETAGELRVDEGPIVRGNAALVGQVLQNLIVNGLKYNRQPNPIVTVRHRVVKRHCLVVVSDNGIGIEPDYLEEIFKPLVRLHTSAEYAGSGLGLTLARKAVTAQGGTIWCSSKIGIGSEFSVRLPLAKAQAA